MNIRLKKSKGTCSRACIRRYTSCATRTRPSRKAYLVPKSVASIIAQRTIAEFAVLVARLAVVVDSAGDAKLHCKNGAKSNHRSQQPRGRRNHFFLVVIQMIDQIRVTKQIEDTSTVVIPDIDLQAKCFLMEEEFASASSAGTFARLPRSLEMKLKGIRHARSQHSRSARERELVVSYHFRDVVRATRSRSLRIIAPADFEVIVAITPTAEYVRQIVATAAAAQFRFAVLVRE